MRKHFACSNRDWAVLSSKCASVQICIMHERSTLNNSSAIIRCRYYGILACVCVWYLCFRATVPEHGGVNVIISFSLRFANREQLVNLCFIGGDVAVRWVELRCSVAAYIIDFVSSSSAAAASFCACVAKEATNASWESIKTIQTKMTTICACKHWNTTTHDHQHHHHHISASHHRAAHACVWWWWWSLWYIITMCRERAHARFGIVFLARAQALRAREWMRCTYTLAGASRHGLGQVQACWRIVFWLVCVCGYAI